MVLFDEQSDRRSEGITIQKSHLDAEMAENPFSLPRSPNPLTNGQGLAPSPRNTLRLGPSGLYLLDIHDFNRRSSRPLTQIKKKLG